MTREEENIVLDSARRLNEDTKATKAWLKKLREIELCWEQYEKNKQRNK